MYDHLNIISDNFPYIPAEAFLYQPISKNPDIQNQSIDSLQTDDYIIKTKDNQIKRLIFQGNTKYTQFQNGKLKEFQDYIVRKNIVLDPRWNRSWKLRWLQSTNYDNKKTVQDMHSYIQYLDKNKEIHLNPSVEKYLKAGVYYVAGRDSKYRPIIILDVKKILQMKITEEEMYQCEVYFFEFMIRNMLIPGQVEMWNTIIDVGYEGVMSMMGPMKSSIAFLQSTFRSRMYVAYIIRPSGTCSFIWSIAQKFLHQDTKRKVVFVDGQVINALLDYCNPTQLEKKFGGSLQIQNNKNWPPKIYGNYFESKIGTIKLTEQQYKKKIENKQFSNTKIYEPFIKPVNNSNDAQELKIQSQIKLESDMKKIDSNENVKLKDQIEIEDQNQKINLIEVDKQVSYSLEKLKQEDISFLQKFNLESQSLVPSSGFDWLTIQNFSNQTIEFPL